MRQGLSMCGPPWEAMSLSYAHPNSSALTDPLSIKKLRPLSTRSSGKFSSHIVAEKQTSQTTSHCMARSFKGNSAVRVAVPYPSAQWSSIVGLFAVFFVYVKPP